MYMVKPLYTCIYIMYIYIYIYIYIDVYFTKVMAPEDGPARPRRAGRRVPIIV